MAYAILRVGKLKTPGNAGGLNKHLTRTMDVPNADPELAIYNSRPIGSSNLNADIEKRIIESGAKVRGDSVRAVEFLMTASPEHFNYRKNIDEKGKVGLKGNIENWKTFEQESIKWLQDRYGKENVVNVTIHKDEQTPHIHAVIVPIYQKDGENRLSAKEALGGQQKMREMQSSFANVHAEKGLKRGIEGSKMEHTDIQDYYAQVKNFKSMPQEKITINLPTPKIELEAPELNKIKMMKETPVEYKIRQEGLIRDDLLGYNKEVSEHLQKKITELMKPVNLMHEMKQEVENIKGQMKGLEGQVKKLEIEKQEFKKEKVSTKMLLEGVMSGKVELSELKKATEQIPKEGNKREEQIYQILKTAGIEVKTPEIKQENKRNTGISL